ncbi:MAG: ArsR family transcriptional regulator [Cuniculiplasma sp. C_DKE]|nr:MAG: ArsR family transcriptional regulator [Cuniculiplasma sp. C_DKE]
MAGRIKVINDPGELVSIFHASDSDVKRKLLIDLSTSWITMPTIAEKYGQEGKRALLYLDKIKMLESQWITTGNGPEKAYHTFYNNVQINLMGTMTELADIIFATNLSDEKLEEYENELIEMMNETEGVFLGEASEKLGISQTFLRGIVKRSSILQIKGFKIEKVIPD